MTLTGLAARNLSRSRFRVALTALAVAIAIVAFLLLRTVTWAWASGAEFASAARVVTRHKVSFAMSLPKRYVEDVRNSPHVKQTTWATWFGGKDPKHDREFFRTLAVDPETYFDVFDEISVPPEQLSTWKHDRQGAIVGEALARRFGWRIGDKIKLESGIYPGDWSFTVDSIYQAAVRSTDRSTLLLHWAYLDDSLTPNWRDQVGWIVSRVDDASRSADVSVALDRVFDDHDTQTRSEDERSFYASSLAGFSAVLMAMDIVSAVILVIMTLILGNTIAMGVRERTSEYGVLRAIGFLPRHIALLVVAESLVLGAVGGLIGAGLATPLINLVIGPFVEENMGRLFPHFRLVPQNVALAIVSSALLGGAAALLPAWGASQLRVVYAVRRVA
jgi:putative ABC transport system permease protein